MPLCCNVQGQVVLSGERTVFVASFSPSPSQGRGWSQLTATDLFVRARQALDTL
jgi:hypothetical protein